MRLKLISILFVLVWFLFIPKNSFSANIGQAFKDSYRYEKMGAYKDAIRCLLPIQKEYPKFYLVNLRLGWLYYLYGKYANSISYYEKALQLRPNSFEAILGLSLPLMAQKRWSRVESLMNRLISMDPYNYYGNLRLAISLRLQNKANLAEKVMRKMLLRYPSSVLFWVELGRDLWWQGKKEQTRNVFKKVLLLDPENVVAREILQKL